MARFDMVQNKIQKEESKNLVQTMNWQNTPIISLTGELCGTFSDFFVEKFLRYRESIVVKMLDYGLFRLFQLLYYFIRNE